MSTRFDVLARDDVDKYYRQISLMLGVHHTNLLRNLLLCQSCRKCPDVVNEYTSEHMPWLVSFKCKSCPMMWAICQECSVEKQPALPGKNTKRMRNDLRRDLFEAILMEHHDKHHGNLHESNDFNESDEEHSESIFLTEHGCMMHETNYMEGQQISVSIQLMRAQLFSEDDNRLPSKDFITDMVLEKEAYGSYTEFLIKKCWVKNDDVTLRIEDCDLFLKIVKELVLSSRGTNDRFMSIIEKIQCRHFIDNDNRDRKIHDLQMKVNVLMEEKKLLLSAIRNVEGFDQNLHACMVSQVSDIQEEMSDEYQSTLSIPNDSECVIDLPLPTTTSEARHLLENKTSFVQMLPIPAIHFQRHDGYSYVMPSDVLELSLALGIDMEEVFHQQLGRNESTLSHRSIFRTPNMIEKMGLHSEISEEPDTLYVPIALWSDGFDAGSQAKSNRSLVKLTTLHIPHPSLSKEHVFPIALGRHVGNHDIVRKVFWDDIDALSRSTRLCFVSKLKRTVPVKFVMSYIIMDRPEHSEWTGFASHAGLYSTVPGISCPISVQRSTYQLPQAAGVDVLRPLSSCIDCYTRRILRYQIRDNTGCASSSEVCDVCDDWSLEKCEFKPNKGYPIDSPFFSEIMKSKPITFDSMRDACATIFEKVYKFDWTREKAMRFGQVECLRTEIIHSMYSLARSMRPNPRPPNVIINCPDLPVEELPAGLRQKQIKLQECFVGLMHTLILNLGRHLLDTVRTLLLEQKMWELYRLESQKVLKSAQSLSIHWCKAWHYGSNKNPSAPWVSENYLAYAFLAKSMASVLPYETEDFSPYSEVIMQTMTAYNSLVSTAMMHEYPSTDVCERMIGLSKIFLSTFGILDNMVKKRTTPKLETASCMVNILSIGETMKRHGILRAYWEGNIHGEGYIRFIKPSINRGVDMLGTCSSVMRKTYQCRCLEGMISDTDSFLCLREEDSADDEQSRYDAARYRKFHAYKSEGLFQENITSHSCLGCMISEGQKEIYILFGRGRNKRYRRIELIETETVASTFCFNVELEEEVTIVEEANMSFVEGLTSGILMPMCKHEINTRNDEEDQVTRKYYLHTENHEELTGHECQFAPPNIHINRSVAEYINGVPTDDSDIETSVDITDRDFCVSFVGKQVLAIDDFIEGVVTSFKYIERRRTFEDAEWTVTYSRAENAEGRPNVKERMNYSQLMDCLIE